MLSKVKGLIDTLHYKSIWWVNFFLDKKYRYNC